MLQELACAQPSGHRPYSHRRSSDEQLTEQLICADMSECSRRIVLPLEPPCAVCSADNLCQSVRIIDLVLI